MQLFCKIQLAAKVAGSKTGSKLIREKNLANNKARFFIEL